MKKLAIVSLVLALGVRVMGDPVPQQGIMASQGETAQSEVEVRVEIIDDNFLITDIYGRPLVLDFGKTQQGKAKRMTQELEYKISAKQAVGKDTEFDMTIGGKGDTEVDLFDVTTAKNNDAIKSKVWVTESKIKIPKDGTEVRSKIAGALEIKESDKKGLYSGKTILKATVK